VSSVITTRPSSPYASRRTSGPSVSDRRSRLAWKFSVSVRRSPRVSSSPAVADTRRIGASSSALPGNASSTGFTRWMPPAYGSLLAPLSCTTLKRCVVPSACFTLRQPSGSVNAPRMPTPMRRPCPGSEKGSAPGDAGRFSERIVGALVRRHRRSGPSSTTRTKRPTPKMLTKRMSRFMEEGYRRGQDA